MTKAIRWSQEQLDDFQKRRAQPAPGKSVAAPQIKPKPKPESKKKPKRSKYLNRKVVVDGVTHDSEKEARRWADLQMMQAAGQISELRRQVAFVLAPAVRLDGEKRMKPALRYWADAVYVQDGQKIVEDTKSAPTRLKESYRIKKHLLATVHGQQIKEV